jgi:hypothetical protein
MRRVPWDIILTLLAGLGLGLVYSWILSPARVVDAEPLTLRSDFKDQYRSAIAAAYAATGNLPRAQARLSLLADSDPIEALNAQAQRMLGSGQSLEQADQVAALASALEQGVALEVTSTPVPQIANTVIITATPLPDPSEVAPEVTETVQPVETQATVNVPTPRPTQTAALLFKRIAFSKPIYLETKSATEYSVAERFDQIFPSSPRTAKRSITLRYRIARRPVIAQSHLHVHRRSRIGSEHYLRT